MNYTLEIALDYMRRGLSVIPLLPYSKDPHFGLLPDKLDDAGNVVINPQTGRPKKTWGLFAKTHASEDQVRQWFNKAPNSNLAVLTGATSGVIVLDIDGPNGDMFVAKQGGIPYTPTTLTGKGRHIWLLHPGFEVHNFQKKYPELDVRGDGGLACVYPSLHPSGKMYTWSIPLDVPFAPVPDWLLEFLKPKPMTPAAKPLLNPRAASARTSTFGSVALDREVKNLINARERDRNNQLNRSAFCLGQLVGGGEIAESDVINALYDAATAIGLMEREIMPTIRSGLEAGKKWPRTRFSRTVK